MLYCFELGRGKRQNMQQKGKNKTMISHITDIVKFPRPSQCTNQSNNLKSCGHNHSIKFFFQRLNLLSKKPCQKLSEFQIESQIPNPRETLWHKKVTIKSLNP